MDSILIHNLKFIPYISADRISRRISEMAEMINIDHADKNPLLICILNGSFIFAADLFRQLTIDAGITFARLRSYNGMASSGNVETKLSIEEPLQGRHIIVVEDIIDTGRTLNAFIPQLLQHQPASITIATFLTKPSALQFDVHADYTAFEIEDKFVVGYGLDYNGLGRNLPGLYILADQQ